MRLGKPVGVVVIWGVANLPPGWEVLKGVICKGWSQGQDVARMWAELAEKLVAWMVPVIGRIWAEGSSAEHGGPSGETGQDHRGKMVT